MKQAPDRGAETRRRPNWELLIPAIPFTCFALYMSYGFYQSYREQQGASVAFAPVAARVLASQGAGQPGGVDPASAARSNQQYSGVLAAHPLRV
jgi:hypothetical protein